MSEACRECPICGVFRSIGAHSLCKPCQISYDRSKAIDDGTLWATLIWAARRARRFEKARAKKIVIVDDDSY